MTANSNTDAPEQTHTKPEELTKKEEELKRLRRLMEFTGANRK